MRCFMAEVPAPLLLSDMIGAKLGNEAFIVPAGMQVHHVYKSRFAANGFNPGAGRGRFHPFQDTSGRTVPRLCAATSIAGSYTETVFRSVGVRPCLQVAARRISRFSYALLTPRRELRLAHVSGDALARLRLTRAALREPGPALYAGTSRRARAIHAA